MNIEGEVDGLLVALARRPWTLAALAVAAVGLFTAGLLLGAWAATP